MRIVSFNINGLNAALNNMKFDRLLKETKPDVLCLQEVKMQDKKLEEFKNDHPEWIIVSAVNMVKKGYAGVSTLIKRDKAKKLKYLRSYVPQEQICENIDPKYGDGRVVVSEFEDFYIVNSYTMNSGAKAIERIQYDQNLLSVIKQLDKPYILCGDLNVCSTEKDFWGNYEKSKDTYPGLMNFEIYHFEDAYINEEKLIDIYREQHPNTRQYTWFTNPRRKGVKTPHETNHGWRLDYFLIKPELKNRIIETTIYDQFQTIDHEPILLIIE